MKEEYFVAKNIEKSFGEGISKRKILQIEKLNAAEGEFLAILGPSGCGKSTFLSIVGGFEKPDTGTVEINGRPISDTNQDCITVFQDAGLFPWRNVFENVCFGLKLKGKEISEINKIADHYLALVGLSEYSSLFPNQLSGGMRQRVSIARALAVDPKLLLMDEPFAAVDALTRLQLQKELSRICAETKKTTLFITHSVDEAIFLGDRVIVLDKDPGRIRKEFKVTFPRDLNSNDKSFLELRSEILEELGVVSRP